MKDEKKPAPRRFIVLKKEGGTTRAYGVYRSFKTASADAKAIDGYFVPLEETL